MKTRFVHAPDCAYFIAKQDERQTVPKCTCKQRVKNRRRIIMPTSANSPKQNRADVLIQTDPSQTPMGDGNYRTHVGAPEASRDDYT